MKQVTLGREFYSQMYDITRWCRSNVGLGCWSDGKEHIIGSDEWVWEYSVMFGHGKVLFKDDYHRSIFIQQYLLPQLVKNHELIEAVTIEN